MAKTRGTSSGSGRPSGNGKAGPVRTVNLALQGGGSHGAFTWGVLDRLLADERLRIEAVTGTSAGAVNAVALAEGIATGCPKAARDGLAEFWHGVATAAAFSPLRRSPFDAAVGSWGVDTSPAFLWFDMVTRMASPYELNPFDIDPLRDLLDRLIDFEQVRRCEHIKVFVSATNVETGRPKIFRREELTADHVLASACLPFLHKAVEIGGVPYWDGGFMGNPSLWPLFDYSSSDDVILVQINPLKRPGVPKRARDIIDRLNEITFNSSLLYELRAIDFVTRLIDAGRLEGTGYRKVNLHVIADEPTLLPLGASSKLNAEGDFLKMLFDAGRAAADRWLAAHFDAIGVRSTVDIRALLAGDEDALDGSRITRRAHYQETQGLRPEKTKV
jgi:NTE family protein